MNINQVIHEALGKCYHEWDTYHCVALPYIDIMTMKCRKCGKIGDGPPLNPDYENDLNLLMDAARELGVTSVDFKYWDDGSVTCSIYVPFKRYSSNKKTEAQALASALVAYIRKGE